MYTGFWQPNMKLASQSSPNKQLRPSCLPGVGLSHRNPLHSLQRSNQRVGDEWNNLQPGRLCDDNPRYSLDRKYFWQIDFVVEEFEENFSSHFFKKIVPAFRPLFSYSKMVSILFSLWKLAEKVR